MKWLHKTLIASKHNNFHPHALRPVGLIVLAAIIAFIPTLYNFTTTGKLDVLGYATNITVGDVHALSNVQRESAGVKALALNPTLNQAAANKAAHMFANNYWAHTAPDGTTPWSVISGAGDAYSFAGENLAKNFVTSNGVVNGWMNSPGHRANVLNERFADVGYAVMNGTLQGQETTLVVALYASPATVAQAPKPAPAPEPAPQPAPTTAPASPEVPVVPTQPSEPPAPAPQEERPVAEESEEPVAAQAATRNELTTDSASVPAAGETSPASVAGAIVTAPLEAYEGLNWGQKASLFLLSAVALLYVLKHTAIWRQQRNGLRGIWLRSHPLAQALFLVVVSAITLASGAGSIL